MAMMQNKASTMPRCLVKEKVLGGGSHGTVFRAISTALQGGDSDHVVAVKATSMLSCALSLQKEENILNSFRYCPEIVQCYGRQITIEDGAYVHNLILEYAPYGTLADLIKKGAFIESQVREYTRMLLRGLSWIHYKGLVHCDLKPQNILVFPLDQNPAEIKMASSTIYQLKIADFGLAMTLEERNNFDPHCWRFRFRGTPFYMSPESVTHGEIKPALDIWSLGCIVLEMVTGLPPRWIWQITSTNEFIYRLIFQTTTPKIPNSVSKDCRDFLSKCFDRNSTWRWTAGMLLHHPFVKPPKRSINT